VSRLQARYQALRSSGKKALIPYIVAGDPSISATVPLMHRLVEAGADIIEIGVPFSDPMSEGPVIQQGHERALENGVSLRDVLGCVTAFRQDNIDTPVVVMGYANPVERMGHVPFAEACREAGVDGLITVDLPPEEVDNLNQELIRVGIDNIFLISPTTPNERISTITERASGFIYYVAVKGVTGAGNLDVADVSHHLTLIRESSSLPVAVGFGIKDAASAGSLAPIADGIVVGSALIDAMATAIRAGHSETEAMDKAITLLVDIRRGIDQATSAARS